jgi:hypothetical protein
LRISKAQDALLCHQCFAYGFLFSRQQSSVTI